MKLKILSSNALKILASIFMLLDHIGLLLFPHIGWLRIIGRLAYPIYAFMISQGCIYTKNKLRYFLQVAGLAVLCQIPYFLYNGSTYMSILVTFSLSILIIYALDYFKKQIFAKNTSKSILGAVLVITAVLVTYIFNRIFIVDYGFIGSMVPVLASLFTKPDEKPKNNNLSIAMLTLGLIILSVNIGWIQHYSLLAVPLLLAYNGKRGRLNLKYYFYIFYPLHLLVLQGIQSIILINR